MVKTRGTGAPTADEREREERLLRIRRCEEELQILRNLPADKVSAWVAARRGQKAGEARAEAARRQQAMAPSPGRTAAQRHTTTAPFVLTGSQPVTRERVRIREHAARIEQAVARGRYVPQSGSDFPSTVELEPLPHLGKGSSGNRREGPGAIRLTDLQQRMVAKSQKRQEDEESAEERKRAELLAATETMSPRHRTKLRRALGKGKSAAQKRYQRLLQLRHKASALLSMRQARQAHGIDARALEERRRLVQQTRALRQRLLEPDSLEEMRKKCTGKSTLLVDSDILPVPEGVHLEAARVAHLQALAVMRQGKEWWRAVRKGEERDIRSCFDPEPCWEGWKNASRLLDKNTFLYGRTAPPSSNSAGSEAVAVALSPGSASRMRKGNSTATSGTDPYTGKKWFVEPALSESSRELSDWWLNYALGALAESSEAEVAIQEAREATKQGSKSFAGVLDRQTRKIIDHYRQQIMYEREDYERQEKLAEATRTQWEHEDLAGKTIIEESLAATMAALDAPLETGESPRMERGVERGRRGHSSRRRHHDDRALDDMDDDANSYISDLEPEDDANAMQTTPSPAPVSPVGGRRTRARSRLGMGSRRRGRSPDAGRKTQMVMEQTEATGFRKSRTGNISDNRDADEGRKTQVRRSSRSPRQQRGGKRSLARSSGGGRRTSFMALETIRGTYDDIIQSPTSSAGGARSPLGSGRSNRSGNGALVVDEKAKTMPDMSGIKLSLNPKDMQEGPGVDKNESGRKPSGSSIKGKVRGKHQRSVTLGANAHMATSGGSDDGALQEQGAGQGHDSEDSRPSFGKLSPGGEEKTARSLLAKLFTNVSSALEKNGLTTGEFLAQKYDGAESLKYEDFMRVLLNLDNNLPEEQRIGLDAMSKARLSAIFKLLEDDTEFEIPLRRVLDFVERVVGGGDVDIHAEGSGGDAQAVDSAGDASNKVERDSNNRAMRGAIKAVAKGARWTARSSGDGDNNPLNVLLSAFEEKDGDATGKITQGMFAKAMRQLGVELTREQMDVMLEDLGLKEESIAKDRAIDYRRLVSHVRKYMEGGGSRRRE